MSGLFLSISFNFRYKILLANNVDPDQTPNYVASDLGLHWLTITLLRVSRKEWAKEQIFSSRIRPILEEELGN